MMELQNVSYLEIASKVGLTFIVALVKLNFIIRMPHSSLQRESLQFIDTKKCNFSSLRVTHANKKRASMLPLDLSASSRFYELQHK